VAELPATGSESTGWFQALEAGKIWHWLSGGMPTSFGVGVGVGAGVAVGTGVSAGVGPGVGAGLAVGVGPGVGAVVGRDVGGLVEWVGAEALVPGPVLAAGLRVGDARTELPGGIEATVPGARPEAIASSAGVAEVRPTAEGVQAVISATTTIAPMTSEGCLPRTV
jgi:hypothetical protein